MDGLHFLVSSLGNEFKPHRIDDLTVFAIFHVVCAFFYLLIGCLELSLRIG